MTQAETRWAWCIRKLEESLRCPICLDSLNCPALGLCGHMVCYDHLTALGCDCPVCRSKEAFRDPTMCASLQTILLAIRQQRRFSGSGTGSNALRRYMDSSSKKRVRARAVAMRRNLLAEEIARDIRKSDLGASGTNVYRLTNEVVARLAVEKLRQEAGPMSYCYSDGNLYTIPQRSTSPSGRVDGKELIEPVGT